MSRRPGARSDPCPGRRTRKGPLTNPNQQSEYIIEVADPTGDYRDFTTRAAAPGADQDEDGVYVKPESRSRQSHNQAAAHQQHTICACVGTQMGEGIIPCAAA